jgi:hypothetical protein
MICVVVCTWIRIISAACQQRFRRSPSVRMLAHAVTCAPVMRRSTPAVLFRALTMPSGARMLQVALRVCVPQTEQAALASVVYPLGFVALKAVSGWLACAVR